MGGVARGIWECEVWLRVQLRWLGVGGVAEGAAEAAGSGRCG